MRSAADCQNINAFYERDLHFHLLLAEMTGTACWCRLSANHRPFFRVSSVVQTVRTQKASGLRALERHARIIEALKTHDPCFAERLVTQTIGTFQEHTRLWSDQILRSAFHGIERRNPTCILRRFCTVFDLPVREAAGTARTLPDS